MILTRGLITGWQSNLDTYGPGGLVFRFLISEDILSYALTSAEAVYFLDLMVQWLRHHNFTVGISVRFRLGLIFFK
jgi:hypothetical protein